MSNLFLEKNGLVTGVSPQSVSGGVAGARVSCAKGSKTAIIIHFAAQALSTTFSASFQQHDAASGGTSKALNVKVNYYYRDDAGAFTKVEVRADDAGLSATADLAAVAAVAGVAVVEVLNESLDSDGGFDYISCDLTSDNAKVASAIHCIRDVQNGLGYEI